jgi:adenosylmethionine-8-amino-7-oxononanoate aminotransferase
MTNATTASAIREPDHVWHGNLQHYDLGSHRPLEIVRGEGCWVWDSDNRRYLDAMAGLWCVNVGYGRRSITDAVAEQMNLLPYYPLTQSHPPAARLASRLTEMLPADLDHIFFVNSGSEAVETALKIARESLQDHRSPQGISRIHDGRHVRDRPSRSKAGFRAAPAWFPARCSARPISMRSLFGRCRMYARLRE